MLTSVLEVSSEGDYVYMDVSGDNRVNEKVTNSKYVSFTTQTGIKVRWHSTNVQLVELDDGDAFSIVFPSVIERIQRREYFRLNTPQGSKGLVCKIPLDETEFIDAPIMDMSVGGVGISYKGEPPPIFSQGAILQGCSIAFPVVGVVPVNLQVCGIWASTKTKSGEQMHHIGLQFVNISRGAENVIQRYMIQLESERISLS